MRRAIILFGLALVGAGLGLLMGPSTARAASSDIVLTTDSDGEDAAAATVGDSGEFTAKVSVTNVSGSQYTVTGKGTGDTAGCNLHVEPSNVPAARSVVLEVSSKKKCDLSDDSEAVLDFEGPTPTSLTVGLSAEQAPKGVTIDSLLPPFVAAAILALIPLVLLWKFTPSMTRHCKDEFGELEYEKSDGQKFPPKTGTAGLATPIEGMPSGWTFKDSWASNLSVGATVFIALFGSEEVLDALFGKAPENALARLVVAGAVAGLFVGLAPLILKTIGSSSLPTIGGLAAAAYCTLIGVIGQILAISWVFKADELSDGSDSFWMPVHIAKLARSGDPFAIISAALIMFLLFYGFWTIRVLLKEAFKMPKPKKDSGPSPIPNDLLLAAAFASTGNWNQQEIVQALRRAGAAAAEYQKPARDEGTEAAYPAPPTRAPISRGDEPRLFSGIL